MNKTLLSAALIAGFGVAAFAPTAHAASTGTMNFSGKVYQDTCVISVNGGATVVLPVVATSAFAATVGTPLVSSATNFSIALTACDQNLVSAQMGTFTGGNINATTGNLKNSLTTNNTNAEIQVLSGASVINFQNGTNAPAIALSSGAGSLPLTARYITTATTTTAGLLTSSVGFTLVYN